MKCYSQLKQTHSLFCITFNNHRSVITALQLPERMKLDRMKGTYILDVNKVGVAGEADRKESSSSSEEYDYDDSQDDNLTEPW